MTEILLIIKSHGLSNKYKLKNNYYGVNYIDNKDNIYYNINKDNKINPILNLELTINNYILNNIEDIELYNMLASYKTHNCINDSIYIYNISLYPEINQPSGHINIKNTNNFSIKLILNHQFVDFLNAEFNGDDKLIISLYPLLNKEFNIHKNILKYI